MSEMAYEFARLWEAAHDQERYEKEAKEFGSTRAAIFLRDRQHALDIFVSKHGREIMAALYAV